MRLALRLGTIVILGLTCACSARADSPPPTSQPAKGKLEHLAVDVKKKEVRVECEALNVKMPLEFFCCVSGTQEHEAVLRSPVKPSDLHLALLMIGLEPGEPVHYVESQKKWLPPKGPPLHIDVEYSKDDKPVRAPAYRWMRDVKSKKEMPPTTWVFCGSRTMEDGKYAADATGYLVSIVNFDLTVIDIPQLASNANETLEWETNLDLVPKAGTKVWMIITPAGRDEAKPEKNEPRGDAGAPDAPVDAALVTVDGSGEIQLNRKAVKVENLTEQLEKLKAQRPLQVRLSTEGADAEKVKNVAAAIDAADVPLVKAAPPQGAANASDSRQAASDEGRINALRERWAKAVGPHARALKEAAQAHYEVIASLRVQQQKLLDESDRIERLIEQLEKQYMDLTTPHPEGDKKPGELRFKDDQ